MGHKALPVDWPSWYLSILSKNVPIFFASSQRDVTAPKRNSSLRFRSIL